MDLGLLVRLGLSGQPYTIPLFGIGTVLILGWRVATWRRRRARWQIGLLWALAVLGYVAVTMTPTTTSLPPTGLRRAHIYWSGWGQPFIGLLVSHRPEVLLNCWLLVPAGFFAALSPTNRRAVRIAITLLLSFIAELGLQPFLFMERAVTTPDLMNNLSGAIVGVAGGLIANRIIPRTTHKSRTNPQQNTPQLPGPNTPTSP